jgi:peptidoglycan/LPS O-acetylase OafA/YrhL
VLLFRLHAAGKLPAIALPAWMPLTATAAALVGFGRAGAIWDVLTVAVLFPAVLAASLSQSNGRRSAGILAWAGAVSYPLYILHPPLVQTLAVLMRGNILPGALFAFAAAIVLIAAAAERWFDRPLQSWFKRLAGPRRAVPASLGG